MPRYYLHLRDGDAFMRDPEGVDLADVGAAIAHAEAAAREILAAMLKSGEPLDGQSIEIADELGRVLAAVRFIDVIRLAISGTGTTR